MSVDYKIGGVALPLEPTEAGWRDRKILDYDGNNVAIYEPKYAFMMSWDAQAPDVFYALRNFWKGLQPSTSVSVTIPGKESSSFTFVTYSGCIVDEPTMNSFFAKHLLKVQMSIRNIEVVE